MPYEKAPAGQQLALFDAPFWMPEEAVPGGFMYREKVLSRDEETALLALFKTLPFRHATHQGYEAQRRVVGYGWEDKRLPDFLLPIRQKAAAVVGIKPQTLDTALISEYSAGAAIGWHRDKPTRGHVIGISLGSACQFRLRRKRQDGSWDRFSVTAESGSVYCMRGESRRDWQHSIPAVEALRYSITFRDF